MAQNVKFIKGDTATINGTAITDGQLLYNTITGQHYIDNESTRVEVGKPVDSALSTTSTNAIANNAITTSIINTTAEVSAITADNIPCGTKPVKELITNLTISYGICTTYSATATYALKSLVIYSNKLYRCTTAITVAEAWNAAHWTAIADTNNGTVYNTTDSSFYGIRGADSVAKKLGSGTIMGSAELWHVGNGSNLYWDSKLTLDVTDYAILKLTAVARDVQRGVVRYYIGDTLSSSEYLVQTANVSQSIARDISAYTKVVISSNVNTDPINKMDSINISSYEIS